MDLLLNASLRLHAYEVDRFATAQRVIIAPLFYINYDTVRTLHRTLLEDYEQYYKDRENRNDLNSWEGTGSVESLYKMLVKV